MVLGPPNASQVSGTTVVCMRSIRDWKSAKEPPPSAESKVAELSLRFCDKAEPRMPCPHVSEAEFAVDAVPVDCAALGSVRKQ